MQETQGYNPYKTGVVGGSDSHNTAVPYRQGNFFGGHASLDGTVKERMGGHNFAGLDVRFENPAGLTGIWAEENTRASLFDAMERKETFATSGPHLQIRIFGGWDYAPDLTKGADWVQAAYSGGVPMGGDLKPRAGEKAPTFVVQAIKDPTSGNLDRIQIVKGWARDGQSFEKVYDVVWAGDRSPSPVDGKVPAIGSTVDIANATYTNDIGSVELTGTWTDPEFDPSLDAFYYARTLEIPTPRWTTIQAKELGIAPPEMVAATVQERAWSSPIWYTPAGDVRGVPTGRTVAALREAGATQLTTDELETFIPGHFTWVRNTVTGGIYKIQWAKNGQMLVMNVDPRVPQPSEVGDIAQAAYYGQPTGYAIRDDKIVTNFGNREYDLAVFKVAGGAAGGAAKQEGYVAASSNEFGFANYELIPEPVFLGTEVKDAVVPTGPVAKP